jgi:hypothetical protein
LACPRTPGSPRRAANFEKPFDTRRRFSYIAARRRRCRMRAEAGPAVLGRMEVVSSLLRGGGGAVRTFSGGQVGARN